MSSTSSDAPEATESGAAPQGGILEGLNPIAYSTKDPINLFIIQVDRPTYPPLNDPRCTHTVGQN